MGVRAAFLGPGWRSSAKAFSTIRFRSRGWWLVSIIPVPPQVNSTSTQPIGGYNTRVVVTFMVDWRVIMAISLFLCVYTRFGAKNPSKPPNGAATIDNEAE